MKILLKLLICHLRQLILGSALVNVYRDGKIIGSIIVNAYMLSMIH